MHVRKIGLGTVQWGMNYGVSNLGGRTNKLEISKILDVARARGVRLIDTAALYGGSEKALGLQNLDNFRIVTKTSSLGKSEYRAVDAAVMHKTFRRSLRRLKKDSVYGLLVHHSHDLLVPGWQYLVDTLLSLKSKGYVQRLGVSIYDSSNLDLICERLKPDIVQLPLNVIDQRLINDGSLVHLHNLGIEVHARSAFLQGLLLMPMSHLPHYFAPWRNHLTSWHKACNKQGFSPLQAALNFVINLDTVNYCILGLENAFQFEQCAAALQDSKRFDASDLSCIDAGLINPSNWKLS